MIHVSKVWNLLTSKRPSDLEALHLESAQSGAPAHTPYPDRRLVDRLHVLLHNIPVGRDDINGWTTESAKLIEELVVARLSNNDIASILAGLVSYQKTGLTSSESHQAFVEAFGKSSGLFQEVLHYAMFPRTAANPDEPVVSPHFGRLNSSDRSQILKALNENGYCVMPFRLPATSLSDLNQAALNIKLEPIDRQSDNVPDVIEGLDPANPPKAGAAYAKSKDLATNATFANLAQDPLITSIASEYLETPVSAIDSVLWYSFPSESASSELAQLFHYDLDTIRWLKVFYYLSDVTEDSGPHSYVEGTHKAGAKTQALLDRGYSRISDRDMQENQEGVVRTVTGPAGTVILGDTRAFHKGHRVKTGYRLIFSPIYAASKVSYVQAG